MNFPQRRRAFAGGNARKAALLYLVLAGLWILVSDRLLATITPNPEDWPALSTVKGLGFVVVTTLILYFTLKRTFDSAARSEEALAQSEERLRTVVHHMPFLVMASDDQDNIVMWNREAERLTGYPAHEMLRNPRWRDLLFPHSSGGPPEDPASPSEIRQRELDFRCADGSAKTVAWSDVSHRVPIPGWKTWGVGVDVTGRKQAEEQLRHAQKMEAVGRLAGGIAHDFNNLLTVISGYAHLLLNRAPGSDPPPDAADQIRRAADRAAELTRQLLVFGRKQAHKPRPASLNDVVGDVRRMLDRVIGEDVKIKTRLDAGIPQVFVDPGGIEQVLMNLAVNARDAMPSGGTLTLETACVTTEDTEASGSGSSIPPGRWVTLRVSDTGIGMDEDTLHRLFEPFFTTKPSGKGTGLGLAVVYGIIKNSDAHITVKSRPAKGSEFCIYFPPIEGPVNRSR